MTDSTVFWSPNCSIVYHPKCMICKSPHSKKKVLYFVKVNLYATGGSYENISNMWRFIFVSKFSPLNYWSIDTSKFKTFFSCYNTVTKCENHPGTDYSSVPPCLTVALLCKQYWNLQTATNDTWTKVTQTLCQAFGSLNTNVYLILPIVLWTAAGRHKATELDLPARHGYCWPIPLGCNFY